MTSRIFAARPLATGFALAAVLAISPARAEEASEGLPQPRPEGSRTTTYRPDYFAQYAPSNALDIVRRVPGFVLEETNTGVRGFSGAAGNVVVNGARPSSKAESLSAMLQRIPARRVLRVEVAPGDLYGSDYAGKSQVLNVVLSREGGLDGNVKVSGTRLHDGTLFGNVEASALIRTGSSSFNLSAGTGRGGNVEVGYDDILRASDGTRLEFRDKVNDIDSKDPFLAASWSNEGGTNRSAHLNLRYAPSKFRLFQTNHVTPLGGPERDDRLTQDYRNTGYEIGGDITRPLAGGAVKFVALANRRDRDNFDSSYNRVAGTTTGGFEQSQKARYDEVLGRLSWSHPSVLGFSAEAGTELAYNRLENQTELYLIGTGGTRNRIDLPIDFATVDEVRSETYLNLGRPLAAGLRLDTTLAYETSRLTVGGDTSARRVVRFFKPGMTLDWKGKGGWQVQASLRREAAQLDFYDFISSAELANGRVNGGNADLMPQSSWEARLTVQRPVLGRGLVKLELGHDWVSQLQDRILTAEGFDAPGNLGNGTRRFARMTFDAPLDQLGLRATRIKIEGGLEHTEVRDPLTGKTRGWSTDRPHWNANVELRRDLSQWSYGASLFHRSKFTFYRTDEIDDLFNSGVFATAFAEYRPDAHTTVRLDIDNLLNTAGQRMRTFYLPNRTAALPAITEFRHRNSHLSFTLSINRTFGGTGAASG
ncbi:TonB-dependent receptor [Novosphingobium sp. TH158]|uniref:TonB-dependent receptor n=1 Tax=Novosphingobium sp. TH158 TaxID=2067455 RepID=UPI000C7AF475|nr:TonB-dependent receptor [Novosphingobium sp. TH158]PLK26965.1 hypothetical protein C0V78_08735 [Novosphingobium sp. TH158]